MAEKGPIDERVLHLERQVESLQHELYGAQRALIMLQDGLKEVKQNTDRAGLSRLNDCVDRLIIIIDGDPNQDVIGLRSRLVSVEKAAKHLTDQRDALKWILLGMGVTNITTLAALLTKLFGGP